MVMALSLSRALAGPQQHRTSSTLFTSQPRTGLPRDSQVASGVIGGQLSLVGAEFRGPQGRQEIKAKMGSFSFRTGGPVIHAPTLAASPNRHSRARHSLWAGS